MLKPRALRSGDRLAIVAPASHFDREEFDQGVLEIQRLGFEPAFDDSVFERHEYLAGPAATRAAAIRAAWADPAIAGLVAVRGGYGSAQVLPLLAREEARRASKPFIGYSDLTAMLTFHNFTCGLVAFNGPMLAGRLGRGAEGYDADSFERALCRLEPMGELTSPGLETVREGMRETLDYAERRTRARIAEMPDGEFSANDWLEPADAPGSRADLGAARRVSRPPLDNAVKSVAGRPGGEN